MKAFHSEMIFSLPAVIFLSSCTKESNTGKDSLPYFFGFNDNSDTSFYGWAGIHGFSDDIPEKGESWSLQLAPGWIPDEGLAEKYFSLSNGSYILKLSADTKTDGYAHGFIRLVLQHNGGSKEVIAQAQFSNTNWQRKILEAPAEITNGDKIIIQLSAGSSEIAGWYAWFDNIQLENE